MLVQRLLCWVLLQKLLAMALMLRLLHLLLFHRLLLCALLVLTMIEVFLLMGFGLHYWLFVVNYAPMSHGNLKGLVSSLHGLFNPFSSAVSFDLFTRIMQFPGQDKHQNEQQPLRSKLQQHLLDRRRLQQQQPRQMQIRTIKLITTVILNTNGDESKRSGSTLL